MGNLCSSGRNKSAPGTSSPTTTNNTWARPAQPKSSNNDPFKGPGRTLSSVAPNNQSTIAAIPSRPKITEEDQDQKVGEDMGNEQSSASKKKQTTGGQSTGVGRTVGAGAAPGADGNDPRSAAARAAEARQNSSTAPVGKLGKQLAAQKRSTGVAGGALQEVSRETRGQRNADEAREAREYN